MLTVSLSLSGDFNNLKRRAHPLISTWLRQCTRRITRVSVNTRERFGLLQPVLCSLTWRRPWIWIGLKFKGILQRVLLVADTWLLTTAASSLFLILQKFTVVVVWFYFLTLKKWNTQTDNIWWKCCFCKNTRLKNNNTAVWEEKKEKIFSTEKSHCAAQERK